MKKIRIRSIDRPHHVGLSVVRRRLARRTSMTGSVAAASVLTLSALTLTACSGSAATASPAATPKVATAPATAASITKCRDGLPPEASIAPGSIGLNQSSWPSNSTMTKIRKAGRLVVGTSGDVRLWGDRNPETGKMEGFDVEVLQQIAAAIGPNVAVTYKLINYGQRLPDLKSGAVQVVADQMTINCARWQGPGAASAPNASAPNAINFSTEYYLAGQKVLVRYNPVTGKPQANSIQDLKGQNVCLAAGSTSVANVVNLVAPANQVAVSDLGDCLVKFQEGEVSAITGDDTVLAGFAAQDPYSEVVGDAFSKEPYGIGIKAGDNDFTRFVNAVLEKMRLDGELARIYRDTMGKAEVVTGAAPAVPAPLYGRDVAKLDQAP